MSSQGPQRSVKNPKEHLRKQPENKQSITGNRMLQVAAWGPCVGGAEALLRTESGSLGMEQGWSFWHGPNQSLESGPAGFQEEGLHGWRS